MDGRAEEDQRRGNDTAQWHRSERCSGPSADQDAFTLIELLVVIAIIALLLAILVPVLSRVRKQAQALVCQSRLRQWGMALAVYTQDNQGRFPANAGGEDGVWLLRGAFLSGKDPNAAQDSFHHFHTKDLACCPLATQPSGSTLGGQIGGTSFGLTQARWTTGSALTAWEMVTPAPAFPGSYGFNQWLFKGFHRSPLDTVRLSRGRIDLDVLSLRGRADIPALLDGTAPWSSPSAGNGPPLDGDDFPVGGKAFPRPGITSFCINRHGTFVNGLFLDWSVRKVGLKELWTLYWYTEFDRAGRWTKAGGVTPQQWPKWMRNCKDY